MFLFHENETEQKTKRHRQKERACDRNHSCGDSARKCAEFRIAGNNSSRTEWGNDHFAATGSPFKGSEQEPDYRALDEYSTTIETLREKGFSYREISEWFKERGVDIDHNAVYRIYTKFMSEETLRDESLRVHNEEEEERQRIH